MTTPTLDPITTPELSSFLEPVRHAFGAASTGALNVVAAALDQAYHQGVVDTLAKVKNMALDVHIESSPAMVFDLADTVDDDLPAYRQVAQDLGPLHG